MRGPALGVVPVDLQVAQLAVRHQLAVEQQGAADTGAEGGHEHQPPRVPGRAEPGLRDAGRVRVVDHVDRPAQPLGEHRVDVGPDPGRVDVRGGAHDAAGDDAGDGDANGAVGEVVGEVRHDLGDH